MKPSLRTALILIAPLIAVTGFGLGMRAGASRPEAFAEVSMAPIAPGADAAYLVISTFVRQGGIDERRPLRDLRLTIKEFDSEDFLFTTNDDSVAVLTIPIKGKRREAPLHIRLTSNEFAHPLADGNVRLDERTAFFQGEPSLAAAVPARAEGKPIALFAVGGGLPVAFESDVIVRISGHAATTLALDPEPGLMVAAADQQPCLTRDLTLLRAQPNFAVTGLSIKEPLPDGAIPKDGPSNAALPHAAPAGVATEWFGALPTSPGLSSINLPLSRFIQANTPFDVEVSVPSPKRALYLEIDSAEGQWYQTALGPIDQKLGTTLPALPAGNYVAVVANHFDARDKSNARLQPFAVGEHDVCARATAALRIPAELSLPRSKLLSGTATVELAVLARRRRGYGIGFASLLSGLLALGLLVFDAVRDTKRKLRALAADAELSEVDATVSDSSGAISALVLAFLAFSTLALVALTRMF